MPKVSKRGGFSDRNAIKPENTEIQLNDFDERTRVQLQNMVSRLYAVVFENDLYWGREHIQAFLKYILREVYSEPGFAFPLAGGFLPDYPEKSSHPEEFQTGFRPSA